MSRFWDGSSSSEDEQDSYSDDSSEEQQQFTKQTDRKFAAAFDESDSDSEDEVREVKSQKDRTWDGILESVVKVRNAQKNNDWSIIQDEFNNVNKQIEKSKMLIATHGMPLFYIKMLAEVEDHVVLALKDKETVKKLKQAPARALNQLKLQVRKHNDSYRAEIADFRADPSKYEESMNPKRNAKNEDSEEEHDDNDLDSLSSNSSESESEPEEELKGRAKWLKKPTVADSKKTEKKKEDDKKVDKKDDSRKPPKDSTSKTIDESIPAKVVAWRIEDKMTPEELDQKVAEAVASRGKKGSDHREILRRLEVLTKAARLQGPRKEVPVLMHLISSMFDTQRSIDDFMDLNQWNSCHRALSRVMSLLESYPDLRLRPYGTEELANISASRSESGESNVIAVAGSLDSFILKLEEEYTKSLQQINPHTQEYVARLANEANLVELQERILLFFRRVKDNKSAASVALLIVEHIYYKHDSHAKAVVQAHNFSKKYGTYNDLHPACKGRSDFTSVAFGNVNQFHPASFMGHPTVSVPVVDFSSKLEELCTFIFEHGDERSKTRALLSSVYYHALHDKYYRARDLFLISHVQDFIDKADIRTQILYNRTVVTLGLCAFRLGLFTKAHDCLSIICSGRTKELLAQGSMRSPDKDIEQEKQERRRQMPYHMHINPELLECCHLTCAMILELPHLARSMANGSSHAVVSRQLRKHLAIYNKQTFVGPPETTREHVLAATKAVLSGDWRKACQYLLDLEVWNLIPGDGGTHVKNLLRTRIQEEAIRCYLLLNSESYDSVDLVALCKMFDLDQTQVRKIICHMIFNKEISASWENSGGILNIYKVEPSSLQVTAVSISEKLGQLLESNERIVDSLVGVYGYKDDWNVRDTKKQWNGNIDNTGRSKNRPPGWKTSHRPVVHKGQKGTRTVRANKTDGHTQSGNRNAWTQKHRKHGEMNNQENSKK